MSQPAVSWGDEIPQDRDLVFCCDWCGGHMPEDDRSLFCSETCRQAARSDVMDTNPVWIERD